MYNFSMLKKTIAPSLPVKLLIICLLIVGGISYFVLNPKTADAGSTNTFLKCIDSGFLCAFYTNNPTVAASSGCGGNNAYGRCDFNKKTSGYKAPPKKNDPDLKPTVDVTVGLVDRNDFVPDNRVDSHGNPLGRQGLPSLPNFDLRSMVFGFVVKIKF